MDYAKLIKNARKAAGFSQSRAAKEWDVKLKTLQGWENGGKTPSGKNVAKLLPFILPK